MYTFVQILGAIQLIEPCGAHTSSEKAGRFRFRGAQLLLQFTDNSN
jgi:hypothetical protein